MNSFSGLPYYIIAAYVFVIGLCIGSFLNVVILRGLSGEGFVFSRSKCPKCNNQLKWYMNIPLLSYLFLKGKCAFCKCKISFQYPLVEFITGCAFLIAFLVFGFSLKTILLFLIFSLFITMSATDFLETVIIDYHAYFLLIVGLIYSAFRCGEINFISGLIGAVLGFIVFEIMARIGLLIVNYRMFGEGDSLIALGLGAIFGIKNLLIVIALSILIQCVGAIPVLIKNAFMKNKTKLGLSYIFVFLSLILMVFINKLNDISHLIAALILTVVLLWSLKNILSEIKNKTANNFEEASEQFCLMPFGPALIFAATICIFYLSTIKKAIVGFFF